MGEAVGVGWLRVKDEPGCIGVHDFHMVSHHIRRNAASKSFA